MKNPAYEQIQARKVKARLSMLQHAQRISGIYHMTAAGQTTWFEFAQAILKRVRSAPCAGWVKRATGNRHFIFQPNVRPEVKRQ